MLPDGTRMYAESPQEEARLSEQLALDAVRQRMLGRRPGPRKLGRYEVREEIGRGGMAEVYSAWDPVLRRTVALKVVSGAGAQRHRSRIIREAQSQARLSHPNVVEIYDVGARQREVFIAMELVSGSTLKSWMRQDPSRPWAEVVEMFLRAAAGLIAAHQRGLVHRDFKPANVLLTERGIPKVADFGLAVQSHDTASSQSTAGPSRAEQLRLTLTGTTMGTPLYMAPEQHRGERLDARADQFAFCVALHEALYGDAPYLGTTVQRLGLEKADGPTTMPRPPGLPRRIEAALLRGLSPRPDDRWPTMKDLIAALRGPRTTRATTYVAAGAIATLASVGAWQLATSPRACEDPSAQTWSAARQTTLAKAAETFGEGARWPRVQEQLDRWSADFSDTHAIACAEPNAIAREKALGCLQRTHARFAAVLDVLESPPPDAAVTQEGLSRLPSPQACLGDGAQVVSPEFAAIDAQVAELSALTFAYRMPEARTLGLEALAASQDAHLPVLEAEILFELGLVELTAGNRDASRAYLERSYFLADSIDEPEIATSASAKLVFLLSTGSEPREGTQWAAYARAQLERHPDPEAAALLLVSESMLAHSLGDYRGSEEKARRAWKEVEELWGPTHVYTAMSIANMGYAQLNRGALNESVESLELAMRRYEAGDNDPRPEYADAAMNLGIALYRKGAFGEALARFDQTLAARTHAGTSRPVDYGRLHVNRALCLLELGKTPQALTALGDARTLLESSLGGEHPLLATVDMNEGLIHHQSGDLERAQRAYHRAWARQRGIYGEEHPLPAQTEHNLGVALNESGAYETAVTHLRHSHAVFRATMGASADLTNLSAIELGVALSETRHGEAGLALLEAALDPLEASNGRNSRWAVLTQTYRGRVLRGLGRLTESRVVLADARDRAKQLEHGDADLETELKLESAKTARLLGDHADAEAWLRSAYEASRNEPSAARLRTAIEAERAALGIQN